MPLNISLNTNSGLVGSTVIVTLDLPDTFDINKLTNNRIYFGDILADSYSIIDPNNIEVVVPSNSISDYIRLEIGNSISNYEYFDVIYEDIVFDKKQKKKSKFDTGIGSTPIYNKDFSFSNYTQISDENTIIQNIYNIILTRPGERIFNPDFGCSIHQEVFHLMDSDDIEESKILDILINDIGIFEPRATILKDRSIVNVSPDSNSINIILAVLVPTGSVKDVAVTIGI